MQISYNDGISDIINLFVKVWHIRKCNDVCVSVCAKLETAMTMERRWSNIIKQFTTRVIVRFVEESLQSLDYTIISCFAPVSCLRIAIGNSFWFTVIAAFSG